MLAICVILGGGILLVSSALRPVEAPPAPRFVASLTTLGDWDCSRTVASLLAQRGPGGQPLDRVYVFAFGVEDSVGGRKASLLRKLERSDGRVTVLRPAVDYGPASKFVHVLGVEKGDETRILLVDDDRVYDPHLLASLAAASADHPGAAAVGARGGRLVNNMSDLLVGSSRDTCEPYLGSAASSSSSSSSNSSSSSHSGGSSIHSGGSSSGNSGSIGGGGPMHLYQDWPARCGGAVSVDVLATNAGVLVRRGSLGRRPSSFEAFLGADAPLYVATKSKAQENTDISSTPVLLPTTK